VAAVVDANLDSSDSDEAYVYDSATSNPPPTKHPRSGMHSRTSSMTSVSSAYAANVAYGTVPTGKSRGSGEEGFRFPTVTRSQSRSYQKSQGSSDENRRFILNGQSRLCPGRSMLIFIR
jgi:hypothetical protein